MLKSLTEQKCAPEKFGCESHSVPDISPSPVSWCLTDLTDHQLEPVGPPKLPVPLDVGYSNINEFRKCVLLRGIVN